MADNVIESASSSSVQQPPTSTSHINPVIPLITAEIHVENQIQIPTNRPSSDTNPSGSSSKIDDEPEAKRKKLENNNRPGTSIQHEKLEYRLGGILCCAVCLDLPKTAMYQLGWFE